MQKKRYCKNPRDSKIVVAKCTEHWIQLLKLRRSVVMGEIESSRQTQRTRRQKPYTHFSRYLVIWKMSLQLDRRFENFPGNHFRIVAPVIYHQFGDQIVSRAPGSCIRTSSVQSAHVTRRNRRSGCHTVTMITMNNVRKHFRQNQAPLQHGGFSEWPFSRVQCAF